MNASEYLCLMLNDGVLDSAHHCKFVVCGEDIDEQTAHVVVQVNTNDCATLIEVLQHMQPFGVVLVAMHRLHGKYKGCLEIDLRLMERRIRKRKPNTADVSPGEVA